MLECVNEHEKTLSEQINVQNYIVAVSLLRKAERHRVHLAEGFGHLADLVGHLVDFFLRDCHLVFPFACAPPPGLSAGARDSVFSLRHPRPRRGRGHRR